MGIPVEKIHIIENISQETVSLEQPVGDDDDKSTLENFIPDDKILRPDQESSRRILSDQIREVLCELNPKERKILEMRYGLLDGIQHTLERVGEEFGVTGNGSAKSKPKCMKSSASTKKSPGSRIILIKAGKNSTPARLRPGHPSRGEHPPRRKRHPSRGEF